MTRGLMHSSAHVRAATLDLLRAALLASRYVPRVSTLQQPVTAFPSQSNALHGPGSGHRAGSPSYPTTTARPHTDNEDDDDDNDDDDDMITNDHDPDSKEDLRFWKDSVPDLKVVLAALTMGGDEWRYVSQTRLRRRIAWLRSWRRRKASSEDEHLDAGIHMVGIDIDSDQYKSEDDDGNDDDDEEEQEAEQSDVEMAEEGATLDGGDLAWDTEVSPYVDPRFGKINPGKATWAEVKEAVEIGRNMVAKCQ